MKLTIDQVERLREAIQDVRTKGRVRDELKDKTERKQYQDGIRVLEDFRLDLGKVTVKIS